ncbi:MAG: hypothetical protein ACYS8W_10110 [Planctomycetota bacterium]|jgi:hypothetical protein
MWRRFLLCLVISTAAFICIAGASANDIVVLKSGRTMTGTVISETEEEVTIRQSGGVIVIPRDKISEVIRAPTADEYFKRRVAIENPNDANEHLELARWCKEAGFEHLAKIEYRTVLRLDPDSSEAREELGYVRYGGRWVSKERLEEIRARAIRGKSAEEEPDDDEEGQTGSDPQPGTGTPTPGTAAPPTPADSRKTLKGEATIPPPSAVSVPWDEAYDKRTSNIIVFSNVSKKVTSSYHTLMKGLFSEYSRLINGTILDKAPREVNVYDSLETMKENTQKDKKLVWYNTRAKCIEAVHEWNGTCGRTASLLAHQGVYLYADRIIQNVFGSPKWLMEGLGAYFAGARISKTGRVEKIEAPRGRLIRLKKAYAGKYNITFDNLVITPRHKYDQMETLIDASWGFVYYLLKSGRKEKAAYIKIFEKAVVGNVTVADVEAALGYDIKTLELKMKTFYQKVKVPAAGKTAGERYDVSSMGLICTRPSKDWKLKTDVEDENIVGQYENGDAKIIVRSIVNSDHHSLVAVTNSVTKGYFSKQYTTFERKAVKLGSPGVDGYLFSCSSKDESLKSGPAKSGDSTGDTKVLMAVAANYYFKYSFELNVPAENFETAEQDFMVLLASLKLITGEE